MQNNKLRTLFALMGLFLLQSTAFGQFKYFGANVHGFWGTPGMNGAGVSLSYLKQVNPSVGYGAELSLPRIARGDSTLYNDAVVDPLFDLGMVWTRRQSPSLILRYRLQPSNGWFVGVAMHLGMVKERFFVTREYGVYTGEFGNTVYVPVAYADYNLRSPFLKFNIETGFLANLGEKMFLTGQLNAGIQNTFAKVDELAKIEVSVGNMSVFAPVNGINGNVGLLLGMGLKL